MDAIFPYLQRNNLAVESSQRLIEPVSKYTRFSPDEHGHHHEIWQYRVSCQQQASQQQQQHHQQQQQANANAQPQQATEQYLPTSHAVTPEAEQHADADGHLDIYI